VVIFQLMVNQAAIQAAQRSGAQIVTEKKCMFEKFVCDADRSVNAGANKAAHSGPVKDARKLDEETEDFHRTFTYNPHD